MEFAFSARFTVFGATCFRSSDMSAFRAKSLALQFFAKFDAAQSGSGLQPTSAVLSKISEISDKLKNEFSDLEWEVMRRITKGYDIGGGVM